MEAAVKIGEQDIRKKDLIVLTSPKNPTPIETVFLSNIDQTVAFPVETIYFYELPTQTDNFGDIEETLRNSLSQVLLIPYYFMAGRLNFNLQTNRLELVCNNAGVYFVGATTELEIKDLKDVCAPNISFQHLLLRIESKDLSETPILTVQVTKFKCGGFSIGFVTNHSILDGKSASEFFSNIASVCRGEGLKTYNLCNDRKCFKARNPPQITFTHNEYTKLVDIPNTISSFTTPDQTIPTISQSNPQEKQSCKVFFSYETIQSLKHKAKNSCSTFEAILAHIWKARTRAVFEDPSSLSSVLFAVDIRSKLSPNVPNGFIGNAVITACATAKVAELEQKPISFCVEMIKEAIGKLSNDYVRSVIDWLEVHKGIPAACNGNFYVSAWWKLPFFELDFGYGRPLYGGPVVSETMDEFVLLLSDGKRIEEGGGINAWLVLEKQKMEKFMAHVYDI